MLRLMTTPVKAPSRTSRPAAALRLAAIGVVGASLSFGALTWLDARAPAVAPPATAAVYLDAFKPLAEDAGFVVENGLKLGLADIGQRRYDDETLQEMPVAWGNLLAETRQALAALTPPAALDEAHQRFLEAMDSYTEVAAMLAEAAHLPGDRDEAIARAAAHGAASDQIWNAGAVIVQDHLRALGGEPVYWLPDPEHDGTERR
ncbi:MAG TPA: hypothetical protein VGA36_00075 [Nitriliruptorales bacterium]